MSVFSTIWGWATGNSTKQGKGSQYSNPLTVAHEDSPNIGIDSALQVSTVWACVSLLVENLASLPIMVYAGLQDGDRIKDKTSRFYTIMHDSPNKRHTAFEFWEFMFLNLVLRGNCYARVDRDGRGEVIAMWPLAADQIEVIVAADGSLLFVYHYDNKGIVYTENDILHIKGMGNGIIGMSPLDYMRSSVGLAINAQDHTKRTFKKDARRPGLLMIDRVLTPEQRIAVKKNFGDIATGNAGELYLLEAEMKFVPLGMSPADIQLLETRQFTVQDLARWFGVPSVLINDTGDTSSLGSSVQQIIELFYKLKMRPMLKRVEQAVHKRVLTSTQRAKDVVIEFNLDALLRSSLTDRMEIYAKAAQNGIYTRNECRKRENLLAMEGGDTLTAQVNLMPIDKLGQQTQTAGTVPPDTVMQ